MTSPVRVDPAALRGYAGQLTRNADEFGSLRNYCDFYCDDAGGLTGLLWATAVPAVNALAEVQYWILPAAREHLADTALNLEAAAARYEQSDQEAAERIWTARPRWSTPENQWVQNDTGHVGDFADPSVVDPPAPKRNNDMQKKIDDTIDVVKQIDSWLAKVLRFSLREQVMPWLTGDWGKVREMAEAYANLGGDSGVKAVAANLRHGMASLSSTWDGPAAEAFEYHVDGRWQDALRTEAEICKASQEGLEALAVQAEFLYEGLDNLFKAFLAWLVGRVLKLLRTAMFSLGLEFGQAIAEVWEGLMLLLDLLEAALEFWPQTVRNLIEVAEALLAGAKATISRLQGDLGAIQSG